MFERLSGDYIWGYTKAIQDIKDRILNQPLYDDCRRHKRRFNISVVQEVLKTMLEDRETIRENPGAFIRLENDGVFRTYIEKDWQGFLEKNKKHLANPPFCGNPNGNKNERGINKNLKKKGKYYV